MPEEYTSDKTIHIKSFKSLHSKDLQKVKTNSGLLIITVEVFPPFSAYYEFSSKSKTDTSAHFLMLVTR